VTVSYVGQKEMTLDQLHPHPENPNRGDIPSIMESLRKHGQYRSVVANKDGTLIAGHHVFYAAQQLKWPTLRVDVIDADEDSARKILLADNRIAELGPGPDMDRLLDVLLNLNGELEGTGYDDEYVKMLEEMLAGAPDLDDLEREAGPLIDDDLIERLVLIVGDETRAAWKAHRSGYEDDDHALAVLLEP
jgi:site-specific DNA-methyltransferase (adenine-specific)